MIAAAAILSLLTAPARPNSALTIATHQVLHCALSPARRVITACSMFKWASAAGLSAGASGDARLSAMCSDIGSPRKGANGAVMVSGYYHGKRRVRRGVGRRGRDARG